MNIALYARVSTETQEKEGTIESQIEALREYAKTHDLLIVEECFDEGYSGMTLVRPGLDLLRDLAQSGSIEGVLILAPDRLSRSQANLIILMEEFKKRNIQVIFTNQTFDDTPEGQFMLQIQGAVAELERAKILDRMRRGILYAVKSGQVIGSNAPYGYMYIPKSKTSCARWEINPAEVKIVLLIFYWFIVERMKGAVIAQRLNDEGVPCRNRKWWSSQIYAILKSETYTGMAYMFRYRNVPQRRTAKSKEYYRRKNVSKVLRPRNEWIGIPVPAIVDQKTWNQAQELLKQNAYTARRNNNKHDYLLRGLVVCGLCGCMASGYVSNQSTYYSCGAKRNKNITSKPHDELIQVKHSSFDEKVWLGLSELLNDPKKLKAQFEKRAQSKKVMLSSNDSTSEFDKELSQLEIQEKRILDAYRQEVINLDELKEQKDKISNRRKVLEAKKKAVLSQQESIGQPQITWNMLGDVSARFQRVMANANFATRDKLIHLLVNSITLAPEKAIVKGNIPITKLDVLNTPLLRPVF